MVRWGQEENNKMDMHLPYQKHKTFHQETRFEPKISHKLLLVLIVL